MAPGEALPVQLVLALLEAECLERLDDVRKVNLVEWDLRDTKAISRGTACVDHAVGRLPPRQRCKLGCDVQVTILTADCDTRLLRGPPCQLLGLPEAIGFGRLSTRELERRVGESGVAKVKSRGGSACATSTKLQPASMAAFSASAAAGSTLLSSARLRVPMPASDTLRLPSDRVPVGTTRPGTADRSSGSMGVRAGVSAEVVWAP